MCLQKYVIPQRSVHRINKSTRDEPKVDIELLSSEINRGAIRYFDHTMRNNGCGEDHYSGRGIGKTLYMEICSMRRGHIE